MKKTLFICFLLFLSGIVLGTHIGSPKSFSRQEEQQTLKTRSFSFRPEPQQRENVKNSSAKKEEHSLFFQNKGRLSSLFIRYSRMNEEQIQQELTLLNRERKLLDMEDMKLTLAYGYLLALCMKKAPEEPLKFMSDKRNPFSNSLLSFPGALSPKNMAIVSWAEHDPETAVYYCQQQAEEYLPDAVREMAKVIPDKTLKWLNTLSQEERKNVLHPVLSSVAQYHPHLIKNYLSQISSEELDRTALCQSVGRIWAVQDWESAKNWISALPEKKQDETCKSALLQLVQKDMSLATHEFKNLPENESKKNLGWHICKSILQDNKERFDWIIQNTVGETTVDCLSTIECIEKEENQYFLDKANDMAPGKAQDVLLKKIVESRSFSDQSASFTLAHTLQTATRITDSSDREKYTKRILKNWGIHVPEQAKDWIRNSNVPPAQKHNFLTYLQKELKENESYLSPGHE